MKKNIGGIVGVDIIALEKEIEELKAKNKELNNQYVRSEGEISVRSQIETYKYLHQKTLTPVEVSSY